VNVAATLKGGLVFRCGAPINLQSARIGRASNTLLARIVFTIEEMGRARRREPNGLVLSTVILVGLASLGLGRQPQLFRTDSHDCYNRNFFRLARPTAA